MVRCCVRCLRLILEAWQRQEWDQLNEEHDAAESAEVQQEW